MEFNFKKVLGDIRNHLAGLTVSQKMLIGTLVIGITVGLVWLVSWAGEPERVPLLNQAMSQDDIGRMTATLAGLGVDYRVEGDRILVPKGRQAELLGRLSSEAALPANITYGFDALLADDGGMFRGMSEKKFRRRLATQNELARCLTYWPGVRGATVIVDKDSTATIASAVGDVTASVTLQFKPGHKLTSRRARMVADFISSAVSDLKRDRITVVDATNGRSFTPESSTDGYSTVLHELREAVEKYYNMKLIQALSFIPDIRPTVNVKLTQSTIERISREFDKAKSVVEALRTEETRSETTKGGPGGEAGIKPMVMGKMKVADSGSRSETSTSKEEFLPGLAMEYIKELVGKGGIEQIDAGVMLPSTYIINLVEAMTDKTPKFRDVAYNDALKAEAQRVRDHASGALGVDQAAAAKFIRVGDYLHKAEDESARLAAAVDGNAMDGVGTILNQYGKPVLLGVVALVSLFLVASMVKRAAPAPLVIRETVTEEGDEEDVAGEAEQLEGVLQGIEVDEDTLRVNSMVEQVNEMIGENIESATGLVRRWIHEDS